MTTIGDILAIVAVLFGTGATLWAYLVGATFLAPAAASRARGRVEAGPWECGLLGVLALLVPIAGFALTAAPTPVGKIVGFVMIVASLAVAGIGATGVAAILADRVRVASAAGAEDRGLSPFAATGRACALLAASVQIPILGWFLLAPALLLVGLGAGSYALLARRVPAVSEPFAREG